MRNIVKGLLVILVGALLAHPALAVIGTLDNVPAATLLYPYFEVDLANANGINTLLSVQNASATAVLCHVTVWTDLSAPVTNFNIYLTGYDMQTVDLRDLIVNGILPQTASAGQDPTDTISPKGILSQDINFASCFGQIPPAPLPAAFVTQVRSLLTGGPDAASLCGGRAFGDNIARGYVTMDTVNNCTVRFPGDAGYIAPGFGGDITFQNVLLGDFFYVNPALSLVHGGTAVHIEASTSDPLVTTSGNYTFYGRYDGFNAADSREPLPTDWGAAYTDAKSDLIVWRDPKVNQQRFTCPVVSGTRPTWFPLTQEGLTLFDMEETPSTFPALPPGDPTPPPNSISFPGAAQRVKVGIGAFGLQVLAKEGWTFLDLNTTIAGNPNPTVDPALSQSFVLNIRFPEATNGPDVLSTSFPAVALDGVSSPHFFPR